LDDTSKLIGLASPGTAMTASCQDEDEEEDFKKGRLGI
jgi:hypothetical protein